MNAAKTPETTVSKHSIVAKAVRYLIPVGFLIVGWVSYTILSVEKEEEKRLPAKQRIIRTTVVEMPLQDYETVVKVRGVVTPHNEVTLNAEVSGKILTLSPGFEDGAYFAKDEVLLELDDADYQTGVLAAEAQLARSSAAFAQEEARAKQARLNWEDLGYDEEPNELVLRLPQLREAAANVKSAEAQLERANRDLERTRIRAPFDGRVRVCSVGLGQSIGTGTPLATIFATDFAEVRLPISENELAFVTLPEGPEDPPVPVVLRNAISVDSEITWKGEIVRTDGTLDASSLELFAIARVSDPFGRSSKHPPLRIGQPVTGIVPGRVLKDVYVVPRKAIRQVDRIYLVNKEAMTIGREVIEAIWSDEEHLIIRNPGLFDGSYLATSQLSYTPDDAKVEIIAPLESVAEDAAKEVKKKTS